MRTLLLAIAVIAAPASALAQTVPTTEAETVAPAQSETSADALTSGLRPIVPENALEHAFVAALRNPEMRPVFRRQLLDSHVALVLISDDAEAAPFTVGLRDGAEAGFVFTSASRVDAVMGADTPRVVLTGRAALERLRGKNVVINARLMPMLTLETEDVEAYLEAPVPTASAGPSQ